MSKIFDLWNTVAGAFGPSGREDAVRETIAEIAGAYIDDVTTDALGNLICRKKGAKNGKKASCLRRIWTPSAWLPPMLRTRASSVFYADTAACMSVTC